MSLAAYIPRMSTRRWVWWGAVVVSFAVLLSGVIALIRKDERPTRSATAPALPSLAPSPLAVSLAVPDTGGQVSIGSHTPIRVEAVGREVDEVSIWDGDRLMSRSGPPAGSTARAWTAQTTFIAARPGQHLLHATATGPDGTAHSAPVGVLVLIPPTTPDRFPVLLPPDTSPEAFAAEQGLDPALVQPAPIDTDSPSAVDGTPVTIDLAGVEEQAAAEILGSEGPEPGSTTTTTTIEQEPGDTTAAPGAGPVLHLERTGCTYEVRASGADGDLVLYAAHLGSVGFERIGEIPLDGAYTVTTYTGGLVILTAGPEGAPTTTPPLGLAVSPDCVKDLWQGDASLVDGILTIPQVDHGTMYLYLSVDNEPAARVPMSGNGFTASSRKIDVSKELPVLDGTTLHLEVWSYDGENTSTAKMIASGEATLPPGMTPSQLIGEPTNSWIVLTPSVATPKDAFLDVRWRAASPRVERAVLQITTQPVTRTNTSLVPPGLVASKVLVSQGKDPAGHGTRGSTNVVIDDLLGLQGQPVQPQGLPYEALKSATELVLGTPVDPPILDVMSIDPSLFDEIVSDAEFSPDITVQGSYPPTTPGLTYWLRIVPMISTGEPTDGGGDGTAGFMPLGLASASARFDGPIPTDPPQVGMGYTAIDFNPGQAANPQLAACVRVTSVPWKNPDDQTWKQELSAKGVALTNPFEAMVVQPFFPTAKTYCPGDWNTVTVCTTEQWLCDLWNGVKSGLATIAEVAVKIWDAIAWAYNGLIDVTVTLLSKLNPYCVAATLAAKAAGDLDFGPGIPNPTKGAGELCEKISKTVIKGVVSTLLISFGLPPELPTSGQLAAIAEGNLTELAVGFLRDLGVPCDSLTLGPAEAALITKGIEAGGGAVPAGVSDGVDVCRDAVELVMGQVKTAVQTAVQTQIVNLTGLPLPKYPIPGFEFELEPRGRYQPPIVELRSTPRADDAPLDGSCRAWVRATLAEPLYTPEDGSKDIPVFRPQALDLRPTGGGQWSATVGLTFDPDSGYIPINQNLPWMTKIISTYSSDCADVGTQPHTNWVDHWRGRWPLDS